MCRAGGMCAVQEVFCGVCAAQEVIMFRVGGLCGVCAAAGLYLWATVCWCILAPLDVNKSIHVYKNHAAFCKDKFMKTVYIYLNISKLLVMRKWG